MVNFKNNLIKLNPYEKKKIKLKALLAQGEKQNEELSIKNGQLTAELKLTKETLMDELHNAIKKQDEIQELLDSRKKPKR